MPDDIARKGWWIAQRRRLDTLAAVALTIAFVVLFFVAVTGGRPLDWNFMAKAFVDLLPFLGVAVAATVISFGIGLPIGFLVGWARISRGERLPKLHCLVVTCVLVDGRRNRSEILVGDRQWRPHSGSDAAATLVPGDRREPAARVADTRSAEQRLVRREKDLLCRILGLVHVAEHRAAHAVDHSPTTLEEAADTSGGLTFELVVSWIRERSARHLPRLVVVIVARPVAARVVVVTAAGATVIVLVLVFIIIVVVDVSQVLVLQLTEDP